MELIASVMDDDWVLAESRKYGFSAGGLGDKGVLIDLIHLLWQMDALGRLEEFLDWIEERPEQLLGWNALEDFNKSRIQKQYRLETSRETVGLSLEDEVKMVAGRLSRKIRRYCPDLDLPSDHVVTSDPRTRRLTIVCEYPAGKRYMAEYGQALQEQLSRYLRLSGLDRGAGLEIRVLTKSSVLRGFENMVLQAAGRLGLASGSANRLTPELLSQVLEALQEADLQAQTAFAEALYASIQPLLLPPRPGQLRAQSEGLGPVLGVPLKAILDLEVQPHWDESKWEFTDLLVYQAAGAGISASLRLLHQYGHNVRMMTLTGENTLGRVYQDVARAQGHSVEFVETKAPTKSNIRISMGSSTLLLRGPTATVQKAEVDELLGTVRRALAKDPGIRFVLLGTSLPGGRGWDTYVDLIGLVHEHRRKVVVDFIPREEDGIKAILASRPDVLKVNRQELQRMLTVTARISEEEFNRRQAGPAEDFIRFVTSEAENIIRHYQLPLILITLDELGAIAVTGEEVWHAYLKRPIDPVSLISSGDSFLAGFLHRYLRGDSLDDAIRQGTACGTATAKKPGTQTASVDEMDGELANVGVRWAGAPVHEPMIVDARIGGGQVLRTTLAMGAVLGQPFLLKNIRVERTQAKGLRSTHVGAIDLVKRITQARTSPYERGSRHLCFSPTKILPGDDTVDMEAISSGSQSLVSSIIEAVLPVMIFADRSSTAHLRGGTQLPNDLPAIYIKEILLPFLNRHLGIDAQIEVLKHGWNGGGEVRLSARPLQNVMQGRDLLERGDPKGVTVIIQGSNLSLKEMTAVKNFRVQIESGLDGIPHTIMIEDVTDRSSVDRAVAMLIKAEFENVTVGFADMKDLESVQAQTQIGPLFSNGQLPAVSRGKGIRSISGTKAGTASAIPFHARFPERRAGRLSEPDMGLEGRF